MRRLITIGLAALALSASGTARSATLDGIQGQVLVNRGGGYKRVRGPMILKPGDTILANPGGSAVVSYADGCNVAVEAGSVVAVAAAPPCPVKHSLRDGARAGDGPKALGLGGLDATTLGIGALVVGGAIGAAALLAGGGGRDKPASP